MMKGKKAVASKGKLLEFEPNKKASNFLKHQGATLQRDQIFLSKKFRAFSNFILSSTTRREE